MSSPSKAKRGQTSRRSIGAKKRTQKKRSSNAMDVTAAPSWAQAEVFAQAHIAAWEGPLAPLRATLLFPAKKSFLDQVLFAKKGTVWQWEESIHPLDILRVRNKFSNLTPVPFSIDYRLVDKIGAILWVRHSIIETTVDGQLVQGKGFVQDIQTEKELELESLQVSEREQNRIGQDLHDDLCQVLAGVSCLLRVAESRIASKVPEEVASLRELNQQIIEAMHRTRALTHGLFPGKIQIADVRGALLELASQVRARFQVEVKTEFTGRFPQHSSNQIIQIYRLTQEAISNAIKHGHATCIQVQLEAKPPTMFLSIIDNGTGLSQPASREKGVGLHIMQHRTSTLGGELDIRNKTGGGVAVSLHYPFQQ